MLTIAASGFLILLTGVLLYVFRDPVSRNLRFFLPIQFTLIFRSTVIYEYPGGAVPP